MAYWLLKTEPSEFSIDDLAKVKGAEMWDGIRNYQARNILRDDIKEGDAVLIYHSSCKSVGVAGTGVITRSAYPCPYQYQPKHKYFDEKATQEKPRWFVVDVAFKEKFADIVPLKLIKSQPKLANMVLVKQGRLSVQPVTKTEFEFIQKLAKSE